MIGWAIGAMWTVLQLVAVGAIFAAIPGAVTTVVVTRHKGRVRRELAAGWRVVVDGATKQAYDYGNYGYRAERVKGEVAVRLVRGRAIEPFAVVRLEDRDFGERLAREIERAEDRATTLNATPEAVR